MLKSEWDLGTAELMLLFSFSLLSSYSSFEALPSREDLLSHYALPEALAVLPCCEFTHHRVYNAA